MKKRWAIVLALLASPLLAADVKVESEAVAPREPLSLWYRRPAGQWVEALPVGNGRLGAMVFGDVNHERLQLNEDTLWTGGPYDPNSPDALAALPEVRRLIFDGKYTDAADLIGQKMMARPLRQMPYETLGDLLLTFPDGAAVAEYRRDLNLDTAIASVTYIAGGVRFTREIFSSPVDQVIAMRLTADKPGQISFSATFNTPQKASVTVEAPDTLVISGVNGSTEKVPGALKFQARVRLLAQGGRTAVETNAVSVKGADSVVLLVAAATSYKSFKDVSGDPEALTKSCLAAAAKKPFDALRQAPVTAHQRLFRRVNLDLGNTDAARRPTDERIKDFANDGDPQLATLYFEFGRYLLLASSRPGGQPANLQGIWNNSMTPPWGSKYTININTEMNYWPAETCNLGECIEPLQAMVRDLSETGAHTAKVMYNARGGVAHHNTDLWRTSAPIDAPQYGMWPTGGAWLCLPLWEHYQFDENKKYLATIYPLMKGATEFFLDTLAEEPSHHWPATCTSLSPENRQPCGTSMCAGPTMDMEILRDLFANTIRAAEILGVDADFRKQVAAARAQIGRAS